MMKNFFMPNSLESLDYVKYSEIINFFSVLHRYTVFPNGSLLIRQVSLSDEGNYKCLGTWVSFAEPEPQIYSATLQLACTFPSPNYVSVQVFALQIVRLIVSIQKPGKRKLLSDFLLFKKNPFVPY